MPATLRDLTPEPFSSPAQVAVVLETIESFFRDRQDRRAVFATAYVAATRAVAGGIDGGFFRDKDWVTVYLLSFANLYRDALLAFDRGDIARVPRPWRRSFQLSSQAKGLVLQDLLLGINAHINHDLPIALVEAGIATSVGDRAHDHRAVNQLLEKSTDRVQKRIEDLYSPALGLLDRVFGPLDEKFTGFSFSVARESAWQSAEALERASDRARERSHIESRANIVAQAIEAPHARWVVGVLRRLEDTLSSDELLSLG